MPCQVPGHPTRQGQKERDQAEDFATAHGKAKQKQYDAKRQATPHRKAWQKEYDAKRGTTPHGKAKRKEYLATPHGKARRKEYERKTSAEDHERKGASYLTARSAKR